ncbi:DUF2505 domain-containing protein [Nocardioides fonticola]|uniref:DUF2505 domain-containing protein n=1 Tax=Nocardioides fonticola TaxID=450363 RepID=A0ABP7Y6V0_9ACTN
MRFHHALTYDAAPAEVHQMLATPAFREAACAAQDVVSAEVSIESGADGAMTVVVDQVQRTDDLPSFARKFAGSTTRAVQKEQWSGPEGGTLAIEAPGSPATIRGSITLAPSGSGTVETVELDIKVSVPLIGGKLEKLLADRIIAGMDAEHRVGTAWLKGDR